jgi:phage terminase large subunit-like protein
MNNIRQLLHDDLLSFFIQVFSKRNPGSEFIETPFQQYICYRYENLVRGDRLVVNQPPRTGKSLTASAYALWRIGRDPTEKIVFLSNNIRLAEEHVYEARKIMQAAWYRKTFPTTRIAEDRSAVTNLRTTLGGGFFAGSMRSSLGGVGATTVIIDDGNRIDDADNPEHLERDNNKFDGEILSRLNPHGKKKRRGIIVNVQHRLAENDLSAHLIAEGFKCIAFALEAPRTKTYRWADETWTRPAGHVLLENYSKRELEKARELQHPAFFYFYQQAQGRNAVTQIVPTNFRLLDRRRSDGPFVISIDAAQGDTASFNVAQVWDVSTRPLHLRKQFHAQCGFADFENAVKKLISRFRPGAILVEKGANGPALISRLRLRFPYANFVAIEQPHESKAERLARHRTAIAAGAISLQVTEPWLDDFILEFVHHPKLGSDRVDATTQLLDWAPENHQIAPSGPFFAGPVGVYASTMQPIATRNSPFSSKTPGIVFLPGRSISRKW